MRRPEEQEDGHEIELLKAVAQAWHGHSGNPRPTEEFGARKKGSYCKSRRPSRFKLEATRKAAEVAGAGGWDFGQSLWDSYEIVTVSKKLEAGLAMDRRDASGSPPGSVPSTTGKRGREKKNSWRNLLKIPSKRFDVLDALRDDNYPD